MTTILSCKSGSEAEKLVNEAQLSLQEEERRTALPKLIAADPDVEIPKLERRQAQLSAMGKDWLNSINAASQRLRSNTNPASKP